jgi:lipoyl(octanoyl) transferase
MSAEPATSPIKSDAALVLQVYLLGSVGYEAALSLQRRLVYQVAGDRSTAALIVCEHPPLITVGRQGSRTHFRCDPEEFRARRWQIRWVNRGGGCLLHLPGQLALYPILPLDNLGLGVQGYLDRLHQVIHSLLSEFDICGESRAGQAGVWVGSRPIAAVGVAVRDWVTYHGMFFNLNPDLVPFRLVRWGGSHSEPMTSLERERHGRLRPALVREQLLEHFAARFPFGRISLFSDHPSLSRRPSRDALAAYS